MLSTIDTLTDEAVAFTADLVRMPTVNPPGEQYEDCARFIGDDLARSDFEVEYIAAEGRPEHTARHPARQRRRHAARATRAARSST